MHCTLSELNFLTFEYEIHKLKLDGIMHEQIISVYENNLINETPMHFTYMYKN